MTSKTILLVDDDMDFLEAHRMVLEGAGYEVFTAHDSDEAIRILEDRPIDGVVLDVMMETRDEGFRLARRLRKMDRTRSTPLLMLTSINAESEKQGYPLNLSDADRDEMWLPVDRFLDKPISAEKLISVMRELVG